MLQKLIMNQKRFIRLIIFIPTVLLLASCTPETPIQSTPAPQSTTTPTPEPLAPEEVLLVYFNTLNTKDYWAAYDYHWHSKAETKETYNYPCLVVGWGATYSSIEIVPYSEYWKTHERSTQYPDKGDIEGQCERFMVSYRIDFIPENFGGVRPGEYTFLYTLVFDRNAWKVFDSGVPINNSCILAMERMSNQE